MSEAAADQVITEDEWVALLRHRMAMEALGAFSDEDGPRPVVTVPVYGKLL